MSLKSLGWGFLSESVFDSERKPVLFSRHSKVGFPSNEQVAKVLKELGRIDAFDEYRQSFIGLHSRLNGKHSYAYEHLENETVILDADSVVRGWLGNRDSWDYFFANGYTKGRSVFLEPVNYKGVLTTSAMLWDSNAPDLPIELQDAMLHTFKINTRNGDYSDWVKVVTRHGISTKDVVAAALRVQVLNGTYIESMMPIINMVHSAVLSSGNELSGQDYVEWMLLYIQCRGFDEQKTLIANNSIIKAISLGVSSKDFNKLREDGVRVDLIPMCAAYDIDPNLADAV